MMNTSKLAIIAALTAFASTAIAQDQPATGQQLPPPAVTTEQNTEMDAGGTSGTATMETEPSTSGTAQAPATEMEGEAETGGNVTVETIEPTVEDGTGTADAPAMTDTPPTGTAEVPMTTETPSTEMAAGTGASGPFIEMQDSSHILGSNLMGADVRSAADEDIGDVKDVLMTEDGQLVGILVGVGGFLGIGEKDVAIPYERLTMNREEAGDDDLMVTLETTREELESAPAFTRLTEQEAMTGATTEGVAQPAPTEDTGAAIEQDGDMITTPSEPAAPAQ